MPVAAASTETFFDINYEGVTAKQQRRILNLLRSQELGLTRSEIAMFLKMPNGSVAGRCNLMMDITIQEGDKRKCHVTGRRVGVVLLKQKVEVDLMVEILKFKSDKGNDVVLQNTNKQSAIYGLFFTLSKEERARVIAQLNNKKRFPD